MRSVEQFFSHPLWTARAGTPIAAPRWRPSVRLMTVQLTTFVLLVVAATLPTIVVGVLRLERSTAEMERHAMALSTTREIAIHARDYQRLSNMELVTPEPGISEAAASHGRGLMRALQARAEIAVVTDAERELVSQLSEDVAAYRRVRDAAPLPARSPIQIARLTREPFERVLADAGALEALDARAVDATLAHARRLSGMATSTAFAGSGLILAVLLLAGMAVDRKVVRPLLRLSERMSRFRHGETDARVAVAGPRELAEVASVFNGMAETLVAQRANELVFVAGVAHDLRNPLSGLLAGLQVLRADLTVPVRARVIDSLVRQVGRLSHMVGDVLDATKIESGQLALCLEAIDLRAPVREMVSLFAPTSDIHEVVADVPVDPVIVLADPTRIEQVLGNLLSNAIKYSPAGGRVDVRVARAPSGAILEVTDHGIGIAEDAIPGLFAPFHRLVPESVAGSGLGLSVVRRIVHAHGGSIEVESTPGRGTTFRVRLPRGE